MPRGFDKSESAFTATAGQLVPNVGTNTKLDFSKWGTPERQKINKMLPAVNRHFYRRRGTL